ncbi:MAG: SixA phosphatase family protein [Solirubrobacterales bacterium]
MRTIFLLRHAKSSWEDPAVEDFDRPLTGRGRRAARAMAEYMAKGKIRPAFVLCSTAQRTRETYAFIEPKLKGAPVAFEDGVYEASRHDLAHRLRELDDHLASVMLVGHNPGLERLAEFLTAGHGAEDAVRRMSDKFPAGALAILEANVTHWAELDEGTCRLAGFVRPKDLDQPE